MRNVGVVIISVFAAIWWVVGVRTSHREPMPMYGIALLITLALVAVASHSHSGTLSPEERARRGRVVGLASGGEGVLILVAVNVLQHIGQSAFAAPVIAMIVGLHFLPLARWLPVRLYYGTGAALITLGGLGCAVTDAHRRLLLVSFGAAGLLWLTAAVLLAPRHTARTVRAG